MTAADRHNDLARRFCNEVLAGTSSAEECMVVLESIILGAMLFHQPNPRHAAEYLDAMTMRVIERMHGVQG
ncbi:MAG: hypothetical protein B7Y35_05935 [Sphingomonadales bacterium 28-64-96]|nr:MAG: hypothetical protein B7Y35_05935 [Sphingomonadales bacterium 28-64-96]